MSVGWKEIKREAASRAGLKVREGDIAIPFDDGDMPVIVHQRASHSGVVIHDIFTGYVSNATYEQGVEYVQKLRLLPTPTSANIRPAIRQANVGVYLKTDALGGYREYVYLCREYMFICDRKCFRIVLLGDEVEIGDHRFLYSAEVVAKIRASK